MAPSRRRAKVSPALLAFGKQLKRYRADLSQANIAERAHVTPSFVGQVELGKKRCRRAFAETIDKNLDLGGQLIELWDDLVKDSAFPTWFEWQEIESEARELTSYGHSMIHGLLQTPSYAAAILHGKQDKVDARLGRQLILERDDPPPPDCLFLIDQVALTKIAGTPDVMREQLEHLVNVIRDSIKIQVVPARADHIGNVASFTLAVLGDLTEIVYAEALERGFVMEEPEDVIAAHKGIKEIASLALPVDQSIELMHRTIEENWK